MRARAGWPEERCDKKARWGSLREEGNARGAMQEGALNGATLQTTVQKKRKGDNRLAMALIKRSVGNA